MRIKTLKYGNFRNFESEGKIEFDTDGKVTIIYGANGDGKTTLHQLFQWILYGRVNFNKTTSPGRLYNLKRGVRLTVDRSMRVWGEIDFEHDGVQYLVRREWEYYKQRSEEIIHKQDGDDFFVQKKTDHGDWKSVEDPEALIEEVLPSGLAPYFFFDGETMIADLKIRGTDSAKTLKKALHSIFDLELYENALRDIGSVKTGQSALGQLESRRLVALEKAAKASKTKGYIRDIRILSDHIESIEEKNNEFNKRIQEYTKRIQEISEQIGTNKSKRELENSRKLLQKSISHDNEDIKKIIGRFGKEIEERYAYLLIAAVAEDAEKRLYMQVQDEEKRIIPGLTKELLINILKDGDKCICGNKLDETMVNKIEELKSLFPPESYKSTYDKFKRNAAKYYREYEPNALLKYLKEILEKKSNIRETEEAIAEIDKDLGGAVVIDNLIEERRELEAEINDAKKEISHNDILKGDFQRQKTSRERAVSNSEKASDEVEGIQKKIDVLQRVYDRIKETLNSETRDYSQMLMREIQELIDSMLTSKREVILSEDFQLQVKDSYGDESKSEGQFAVVSFAYIGGILKVLKNHKKLAGKEYPLILDGPFSKLDEEQKRNVANTIPQYAPQVIIFSKDPLQDFIEKDRMGRVWTIQSNDEKNNASVEEGYQWN